MLTEYEPKVVCSWLSEIERDTVRVGLRDSDSVTLGDGVPLHVCEIDELPEGDAEVLLVELMLGVEVDVSLCVSEELALSETVEEKDVDGDCDAECEKLEVDDGDSLCVADNDDDALKELDGEDVPEFDREDVSVDVLEAELVSEDVTEGDSVVLTLVDGVAVSVFEEDGVIDPEGELEGDQEGVGDAEPVGEAELVSVVDGVPETELEELLEGEAEVVLVAVAVVERDGEVEGLGDNVLEDVSVTVFVPLFDEVAVQLGVMDKVVLSEAVLEGDTVLLAVIELDGLPVGVELIDGKQCSSKRWDGMIATGFSSCPGEATLMLGGTNAPPTPATPGFTSTSASVTKLLKM